MPAGSLRLILPSRTAERFAERFAERAYLAGPDLVPWTCRTRIDDGQLVVERNVSDSGRFYVPWPVDGHGEVVLCTGTLMEREKPYHLLVELARGEVNKVRNQIAEWQAIGLVVPAKVEAALAKAQRHLSLAVTSQHEVVLADEQAEKTILAALDVGDLLVACYTEQALAARHRQSPRLGTSLGANLGPQLLPPEAAAHYSKAFNAAMVPFLWREVEAAEGSYLWDVSDRQIEWCSVQRLSVCGGPLLRLDPLGLPDWLCLWEGDFNNIQSFVSDYIETTVHRYRGKVHVWQCAARVNVGQVLSLSEEDKLRLAVRAIQVTREADAHTPLVVRFDQPWAEYMSRTSPDLSPLHFADALVRAGLQLAGIALEINVGYHPGGSYPRDRLEWSRLIDLWSYLGLPLQLVLTVPGGEPPQRPAAGRPAPLAGAIPGGWSRENQAAWIKHYLPLLLAKPAVQAIYWNQLFDGPSSEFPCGGLFDESGAARPALAALAHLRKKHLA